MEDYADDPTLAAVPNYSWARADYGKAFSTLATTPGLDMNEVCTDLVTQLQADFNHGA